MTIHTILPWHTNQWHLLWEATQRNRLPHAVLFAGACDLEKKHFAQSLSATLLCAKPTLQGESCKECHSCHLIKAQSHPDLIWVEPEEVGQIIKIDQVRELVEKVQETSMQGGLRIVILSPAHAMNMAASNALLKTLEEPAPNTLLILISDQRLRLPATITSRCQKVMFHKPARKMASAWLQSQLAKDSELLLRLADGFPLKALTLQAEGVMTLRQDLYQGLHALRSGKVDPLLFAVTCQEYNTITLLVLLQSWLRDFLRFKLTQGEAELINSDYRGDFADIARVISLENSVKYLDLVQYTYAKISNRLNLNKQLLLEELWITWTRYVSC